MIIIATVGTSLLTNLIKKNFDKFFNIKIDDNLSEKIRKGTAKSNELNIIDFREFLSGGGNDNYKTKREEIVLFDEKYPNLNLNASAEIKSICKIADGNPATVYLIATDTDMSEFAAEKIQETFNERENLNINVKEVKRIPDLTIDDPEKFENSGFENLINAIDEIYNNKNEEVILNISGGYKALIPFMTIYAQLKELPVKYIYEDSEKIIEISNLPINFDLLFVETIKPFLVNYFLKENDRFGKLLQIISNNNFEFINNKYQITGNSNDNQTLKTIPEIKHQLVHTLIKNKLIINNDGNFRISYLGNLLNKVSVGGEKGLIMEHILFKYFCGQNKDILVEKYEIDRNNYTFNKKNYSVNNGKVHLDNNKSNISIGDIDITLKKDNTIVLGEIKAYSAASEYHKLIKTEKDYYYKLIARAKALREVEEDENIEIILFVYRFVLKDINENDDWYQSNHFKKIIHRLFDINKDKTINNTIFKCIGIKIPVKFDRNNNLNFEDFYKGKTQNWVWEEIKE